MQAWRAWRILIWAGGVNQAWRITLAHAHAEVSSTEKACKPSVMVISALTELLLGQCNLHHCSSQLPYLLSNRARPKES